MPLTPLASLPPAADFLLIPLARDLRACAKWRKVGIRVSMRGDAGETRAEAWACDSRCPGLLVQLAGNKKNKHLGLLHVATGWAVGGPAVRWPATPAGLELALAASAAAVGLLPAGAWAAEDPIALAEGGRDAFTAAARAWARRNAHAILEAAPAPPPSPPASPVGSPSTWYVGGSAPLKGWPAVIREVAEDAARTDGRTVEVLGYADAVNPGTDLARLVLAGEEVPPVAADALEWLGRWRDGAPTLRGLLWAARAVLAAGGPAVEAHATPRSHFEAWQAAREEGGSERLGAFVCLLASVRRTPDDGVGSGGAELFPGRDGHVGVADVSPFGSARWRLFRRSLRWLKGAPLLKVDGVWDTCGDVAGRLKGAPLLKVDGVWDTCGDVAGRYRYTGDAMDRARERARWVAEHPDEAIAQAQREESALAGRHERELDALRRAGLIKVAGFGGQTQATATDDGRALAAMVGAAERPGGEA